MKKLISVLLATLAAFSLVGCNTTNDSSNDSNSMKDSTQPVVKNGIVNFLDFEEYNPDFQLFRGTTGFGKISQNSDMQYVKSGNYSAKVQPIGYKGAEAKFFYPLVSELNEFDYSDISQLEMVSLSVYNTQDTNKTLTIGFGNNSAMFGAHTFTLKPGWNNLAYFPEIDMLNISSNIYKVEGLAFRFEPSNCYYLKDAPTYYIDDIKFKFDENKEVQNLLQFDDGELIDFEKDFHHYALGTSGSNVNTIPKIEIVKAVKEGIVATQGEKVLKVTYTPDPTTDGKVGIVQLPEKLVNEALKDIPKSEITSYVIKFDSYAKTKTMSANNIATYGIGGVAPRWYTNGEDVGWGKLDFTFTYGQWKTHTIPLFRSEAGMIEIIAYLWAGTETADVYFDNFRIEKIS